MFEIIKPGTQIDFVGKRFMWIGISVVAILLTAALFFTKGLNYGIDFTGGAEVNIQVPNDWDIGKVRKALEDSGMKDPHVVQIGDPSAHQFIVRTQGDEAHLNAVGKEVGDALGKSLQPGQFQILKIDVVGPAAGKSLRMSGFLSMFYALICILVYVTIRFDIRYSPGAVLALFHDTVITLGIFIITQKQFDLQILAAILALIGYSNNDTIIVYDRVRETAQLHPGMKIEDVVNRAVNETLGRTILTSACTFFTVFALWAFGGSVIQDFAFTLMIGVVVGTYSSIFIASSLVIYFSHWQEKQAAKVKVSTKKKFTPRQEPKFQA